MTERLEELRAIFARSRATTIGAAVIVAVLIGCVAVPHRMPFGIVLQGALYGSVTGLLGLGLVLTYRSDRIVNFSYGAMGGVGGSVGVLLYLGKHWNYVACLLIGLAVGALVGAGTEVLVIRRFARAPRLILTVATIGLAQVLGGIQLLLPKWLSGSTAGRRVPHAAVRATPQRRTGSVHRRRPARRGGGPARHRRHRVVPAAHRRGRGDPCDRGQPRPRHAARHPDSTARDGRLDRRGCARNADHAAVRPHSQA